MYSLVRRTSEGHKIVSKGLDKEGARQALGRYCEEHSVDEKELWIMGPKQYDVEAK